MEIAKFLSSLFVYMNEHGENIAYPKDTDDKIIIGYTKDGMAFQIVVDGFFGGERHTIFSFIDSYVVPLMEEYSSNLSRSSNAAKVTELLIQEIYSLRREHAAGAEFTMSLSMAYQKDNTLFCAGFGIGDTGIIMKRVDGTIEQLVCHTEVDEFKDAFDNYSSSNIELVTQRNSIFNTQVKPGDELVGYTYVPPELEKTAAEFETESVTGRAKQVVKHLKLDLSRFNSQSPLFSQFLDVVNKTQELRITQAKSSGKLHRFGDDFSVSRLVIPDTSLMNQLRINAFLITINYELNSYIDHKNEYKGLSGLFAFFTGINKNIERATVYKNLLVKYQHNVFISLIILFAIASSSNDNHLNQYLIQKLDFSSILSLQKIYEQLILNELKNCHTKDAGELELTFDNIKKLAAKIPCSLDNPMLIDEILHHSRGNRMFYP